MKFAVVLLACLAVASATVHFKETFGKGWEDRWTQSEWKKSSGEAGKFKHTAGDWYGDAQEGLGLATSEDAKFYATTAKFPSFSNKGKTLVLQFQVKFPQGIDCGGGYLKFLPSGQDPKEFTGESKYNIMFGPDICGTQKRVHVIFSFNGVNHLIKKEIRPQDDKLSHVYTLIVNPDDTYEVRIDGEKKQSGSLADDWDFMKPKKIKDPAAKKPSDWVDNAKMDDPNDKKPEGWDTIPKEIPDPEAVKPADWDSEDGEWEPGTIPNPEYKGEWKPRQIDNPAYKGPWVHPEIDNPDYVEHKDLHAYPDFGGVAVDVWQVKSGTIFDNILVTDNVAESEEFLASTWKKNKDAEKEMFDKAEAAKREKDEAERKKNEEKKKEEEKKDDDDDDADDKGDKLKEKIEKEEL